jgi:hypothetical protein
VHLFRGLGGNWNLRSGSRSFSTTASGAMPTTGTTSGITVPSTCVSVITRHTTSVPGGYDYYMG